MKVDREDDRRRVEIREMRVCESLEIGSILERRDRNGPSRGHLIPRIVGWISDGRSGQEAAMQRS